jgi:serine protease Do
MRYITPILLIASTLVLVAPTAHSIRIAKAVSSIQVGQIAKKTVVRIESSVGDLGSGVIIGRKQQGDLNTYTVLTSAHVVDRSDRSYQIISPIPLNLDAIKKRSAIKINRSKDVKILPKVDLAVISFESKNIYAVGTIGNSEYAEEGSPIYVAGFPSPGKAIPKVAFQFTGGMVSSRLEETDPTPSDSQSENADRSGYDMAYTCVTRAGMSGGPVFDAAGRIIAIHGRGDRENQKSGNEEIRCDSLEMNHGNQSVNNSPRLASRHEAHQGLNCLIDAGESPALQTQE